MRMFRVLALSVLVVLFVAAPNVSAKVCHPKKPVTCNATTLSRTTTVKAPVKVHQQAMVCMPWHGTFLCRANTLA